VIIHESFIDNVCINGSQQRNHLACQCLVHDPLIDVDRSPIEEDVMIRAEAKDVTHYIWTHVWSPQGLDMCTFRIGGSVHL
jgi:hypothetical protein